MMTLGLDLGKKIGWVKGDTVGPIESGTFELEETTDLGLFLQSSDAFLMNVLPGVKQIAYEQPYLGDNLWPAQKLLALLGHVAYHARFQGIGWKQMHPIANSTGKKKLAGHGHAEKPQMIEAAKLWGLDDPDEHEADALGVWLVKQFGPAAEPRKAPRHGPVKIIKP